MCRLFQVSMKEKAVALQFCEKLWTILGVCGAPNELSAIGLFSNFWIIANNLILFSLSFKLLLFEYYSTPVAALSFASLQMISALACGGSYSLIALKKQKASEVIEDIRETVELRRDQFNKTFYANAERMSTFVTKWFAPINICLFAVSLIVLNIGFLIYDLLRFEIDVSRWYNVLQIRWIISNKMDKGESNWGLFQRSVSARQSIATAIARHRAMHCDFR